MKQLFIAEKPSMAKMYCEMLEIEENQSFSTKDGYHESNDYYVSWVFGHLITLAEPAEYGWTEWKMEFLPMLPEPWKLIIKDDKGIKNQFSILKDLTTRCSSIINGADPDREGELIVRLVLNQANVKNIPQFRFWNHSTTLKDLTKAWLNKKPAEQYNNLYAAAMCRQRADWLIGMNLSRAYAIKSETKGISVGRVQTPTLAMVVERDLEIENWKQSFFSELHMDWNTIKLQYIGEDPENKYVEFIYENEINQMNKLQERFKAESFLVHSLITKEEKGNSPLFYNLTDLQKDSNTKYGHSADHTLSAVQSLYEKGILSYPRTDCNFVTEDIYEETRDLMLQLNTNNDFLEHINEQMPNSFNSKKVTAHTALIPTSTLKGNENALELEIFNLVKDRFIMAFGKQKLTQTTNLVLKNSNTLDFFKTTHKEITYYGWENYLEKSNENNTPFPEGINSNSNSVPSDVFSIQKERSKPKRFTEASLLTAMENASRHSDITDGDLKDAIKVNGLGTVATRGAIISSLKTKLYIKEEKKYLVSTEKARSLIAAVNEKVKSPVMTAEWEHQLHQIEEGTIGWKEFYNGIVEYTRLIVNEVKNTAEIKIVGSYNQKLVCPDCKNETLRVNSAGAFCSKDDGGCDLKLFKKQFGKELNDASFNALLLKNKSTKQKFKSKNPPFKPYEAYIIRKNSDTSLEFPKTPKK